MWNMHLFSVVIPGAAQLQTGTHGASIYPLRRKRCCAMGSGFDCENAIAPE